MPKTRIVEKTVYTFDELSDKAKDVARDWYREGDHFEFAAESVFEMVVDAAKLIGIDLAQKDICYQGFSYQGDGASYVGTYRYMAGGARAIADEFPEGHPAGHAQNNALNRIARTLEIIQRTHGQAITATIRADGRSSHSRSMDIDVERNDSTCWNCKDGTLIPDSGFYKCRRCQFLAGHLEGEPADLPDATVKAISELLRDFADWIFACLRDEYEHVNSNEQVDESILANEYEFDEDGNRT